MRPSEVLRYIKGPAMFRRFVAPAVAVVLVLIVGSALRDSWNAKEERIRTGVAQRCTEICVVLRRGTVLPASHWRRCICELPNGERLELYR